MARKPSLRIWTLRAVACASLAFIAAVLGNRDGGVSPRAEAALSPVAVPSIAKSAAVSLSREAVEDQPVWKKNAVAAAEVLGRPMLTIVIDDMGIDPHRSRKVIELPGPLTTSFLPYGRFTPKLAPVAHAGGHELLVHLPMEPMNGEADPGPHALMERMAPQELHKRLLWNLGRFDGYVGINNHMGSEFTANAAVLRPVLQDLDRRGLLYLDSRTTPRSATRSAANGLHLPVLERDVFLDNVREERAIWAQLKQLEAIAERHGGAIAIGHPYDETINVLSLWLPRVEERGFVLVPLSAQVDDARKTRLARR